MYWCLQPFDLRQAPSNLGRNGWATQPCSCECAAFVRRFPKYFFNTYETHQNEICEACHSVIFHQFQEGWYQNALIARDLDAVVYLGSRHHNRTQRRSFACVQAAGPSVFSLQASSSLTTSLRCQMRRGLSHNATQELEILRFSTVPTYHSKVLWLNVADLQKKF